MTTFQRKHYKAIANVIKTFPVNDRVKFVSALNDAFKADNDQYVSNKFIKACGLCADIGVTPPLKTLRERGLL
jgi:hypothetical protein